MLFHLKVRGNMMAAVNAGRIHCYFSRTQTRISKWNKCHLKVNSRKPFTLAGKIPYSECDLHQHQL